MVILLTECYSSRKAKGEEGLEVPKVQKITVAGQLIWNYTPLLSILLSAWRR